MTVFESLREIYYDYIKPFDRRTDHIKVYKDGTYRVMSWYIGRPDFNTHLLDQEKESLGL